MKRVEIREYTKIIYLLRHSLGRLLGTDELEGTVEELPASVDTGLAVVEVAVIEVERWLLAGVPDVAAVPLVVLAEDVDSAHDDESRTESEWAVEPRVSDKADQMAR